VNAPAGRVCPVGALEKLNGADVLIMMLWMEVMPRERGTISSAVHRTGNGCSSIRLP